MDLSYPQDSAVNNGVSKNYYRGKPMELKFPNVDSLIQIIRKKNGVVLLFKCDLKSTYKQIFVCVGEIHVLGYVYNGKLYFNVTVPMGLTNSAYICQRVTDAIIYIYEKEGYSGLNYLDDLASAENEKKAEQAFQVMGLILDSAGK